MVWCRARRIDRFASMRLARLTSLGPALLAVSACFTVDIAGSSAFNFCPQSRVITAGDGVGDFKQRIPKQTALAPPDSLLDVRLVYPSGAGQADRDRIAQYSGTDVLTGRTGAELTARFRAQDLTRFVADDTGRLSDAVIYIPSCASE